MKRPNLRIIGIKEGVQLKGTKNILNKIIEENFLKLKKDMPMKLHEAYRTPNKLDPNETSSCHSIIKTLNIQSKGRTLRAAKKKGK